MKNDLSRVLSATVFAFCLIIVLPSLSPKVYAQSSAQATLFDPKIDPGNKPIALSRSEREFISNLARTVETITPQTVTIQPFPTSPKQKPQEKPADPTPTPTVAPVQKAVKVESTIATQAAIAPVGQVTMTPVPTIAVQETVSQVPHPLNADKLFDLVNNYRTTIGLPAYQKEDRVCKLADERALEIYDEIFVTYSMHKGLQNRNLDYWIWENIIYQNTEEQALNWWLNSPIHKRGIESDMQYSCTKCSGNSCAQLFTSFVPKATH